MKLTQVQQQIAAHHLTEMVGSAIGVALLAADDFDSTKANLLKAINDFPAEMRDVLTPEQKTDILAENTRNVRWHSRELYRVLDGLSAARKAKTPEETPDDLGAPEEPSEGAQTSHVPATSSE